MASPPNPYPGDSLPSDSAGNAEVVKNSPPAENETSRDVLVALSYGLELVRCGAMLVSESGYPHLTNQAARAILHKKDGLSLARTGLVADRASDTKLLHHLLREAISSP